MSEAADRLGRRLFSGMIVSASILSGSILIGMDKLWLGGTIAGLGVAYAMGHMALMFLLGRNRDL